jgi:VanZ family protein
MNRWPQRCYRYGPAVALSLVIPLLSLLPARFFTRLAGTPSVPGMDKLFHALMYAALSLSFYHALSPRTRRRPAPLLALAACASIYGALLECGQGLLTHSRATDPWDALANTAGAFSVILAIMLGTHVLFSRHE